MHTLHKKRNILPATLLCVVVIVMFVFPLITFAAEDGFVSLTKISILTDAKDFSGFIEGMFKLGLAIAATLAVVVITIGGFEYMGSESVFAKSTGRERIQNAVVGLLIALLIWLILFTINPNLLKFDLKIKDVTSTKQKAFEVSTPLTSDEIARGSTFKSVEAGDVVKRQAEKSGKIIVGIKQTRENIGTFTERCAGLGGELKISFSKVYCLKNK